MSVLLKTRIRILSRAITTYISAVSDAIQTVKELGPGKPTLARAHLSSVLFDGISEAASQIKEAALAVTEECEKRSIDCPLTHEVAFAPAWLQMEPNDGAFNWSRVKNLGNELLAIREAHAPPDRTTQDPPPALGFLQAEDVMTAYPDLTTKEWDNIRQRLTRRGKRKELPTGDGSRPRYEFPADAVSEEVHIQRSKRPPNRPGKNS